MIDVRPPSGDFGELRQDVRLTLEAEGYTRDTPRSHGDTKWGKPPLGSIALNKALRAAGYQSVNAMEERQSLVFLNELAAREGLLPPEERMAFDFPLDDKGVPQDLKPLNMHLWSVYLGA